MENIHEMSINELVPYRKKLHEQIEKNIEENHDEELRRSYHKMNEANKELFRRKETWEIKELNVIKEDGESMLLRLILIADLRIEMRLNKKKEGGWAVAIQTFFQRKYQKEYQELAEKAMNHSKIRLKLLF